MMARIPPNPRKVGYIVPIHGPLDGPLYMGLIYSNNYHALFQYLIDETESLRPKAPWLCTVELSSSPNTFLLEIQPLL